MKRPNFQLETQIQIKDPKSRFKGGYPDKRPTSYLGRAGPLGLIGGHVLGPTRYPPICVGEADRHLMPKLLQELQQCRPGVKGFGFR